MTREIVGNTDPNVVRVFVVRHGRTDWNAKKILQGHIDIDINDDGREQAHKLGQHFRDIELNNIISSDLSRCVNTAKYIRDHQPGATYVETSNLRERNMGEVQGMPLQEALEVYGVNFRNLGEQKEPFLERVTEVWNNAIKTSQTEDHTNILLCTHGGVIGAFINHLHDENLYALGKGLTVEDLRVPFNTSISVIDIDKESGKGIIQKFGNTEHLGGNFKVVNQMLR